MILALAGGVGGARLAHGLAAILPPEELIIVVNTGDDFVHLGLHISPDPDTVMHTLAGIADQTRGWGQVDESWAFMSALERLGGETWFALGDKDLATHIERTRRLSAGETLSSVMRDFAQKLGVAPAIVPMSDDLVRTVVRTDVGALSFQDYFVRQRCVPAVRSVEFSGASVARPSEAFRDAMHFERLSGIVICPSNPILSIAPILALPGVREWLARRQVPAVAISPLIGGEAVKGPLAKILRELGMCPTSRAIADCYDGLIDGIVIDRRDADEITSTEKLSVLATDVLMRDEPDRARLAIEVLKFIRQLVRAP